MNSVVGPIFNEIFVEKKIFVGLMNSAQDPLKTHHNHRTRILKKKRKKKKKKRENEDVRHCLFISTQTGT